ncbi:unnamed protein product, partial [Timema podura]|nr:unnamed protein product [Timema podura]
MVIQRIWCQKGAHNRIPNNVRPTHQRLPRNRSAYIRAADLARLLNSPMATVISQYSTGSRQRNRVISYLNNCDGLADKVVLSQVGSSCLCWSVIAKTWYRQDERAAVVDGRSGVGGSGRRCEAWVCQEKHKSMVNAVGNEISKKWVTLPNSEQHGLARRFISICDGGLPLESMIPVRGNNATSASNEVLLTNTIRSLHDQSYRQYASVFTTRLYMGWHYHIVPVTPVSSVPTEWSSVPSVRIISAHARKASITYMADAGKVW